ncbi:hypothetical protein QBC47DRAFT_182472 [Echria macrotheca]|uniref:Prolyl 4-hydroxylase alpha subunit domain-containing protein n=1 Tax=Echria macrotheca TaxID=438768 RepID=A0AAJ0F5X6_9PEZI|nr:hypothetical protein QBC47DRAFT_182472 [Echria macrotheca]
MLAYAGGFLIFVLFLYNPLLQLLSPGTPQLQRTPRPQINEDLLALEKPNRTSQCPPDSYSVHIFSREPLVLYIENFLNQDERDHLLDISNPIFEPSTITHDGGDSTHRDATIRDSEVAVIPRTDTVGCIEDRARALQGWRDEVWIERLRVQRYGPNGHYNHHFDWSTNRSGWGRVSSFMVWVDDGNGSLRGGGTEFPLLQPKGDPRWCAFVECPTRSDGQDNHEAEVRPVVFKPLPGNAVYWENFRADNTGRGYQETWHAGLPVTEGIKVGLNIWSWGRLD